MAEAPDPPDLQACREQEHNYEEQRTAFIRPLIVRSLTDGSEILDIRLEYHQRSTKSLSQCTPDDARQFANKSTAIYATASSFNGSSAFQLFTKVYETWFPHRPRDEQPHALWYGSFFANVAKLDLQDFPGIPDSQTLLQPLCAFHSRLADRLVELLPQTLTPELSSLDRRFGVERAKGKYKMCESWGKVFVWIHREDWMSEGVRLVVKDREIVESLGLNDEKEEKTGNLGKGMWPEMQIYRMKLEKAVKVIMALDGGGAAGGEKEWNYMTLKWYDGTIDNQLSRP